MGIINKIRNFFCPEIDFEIVEELPEIDIKKNVIYLLKNPESTDTTDQYTEYAYVNGHFERLGSEHATIVAENISDESIKKLWTE